MQEYYYPPSAFLRAVIAERVPLEGSAEANENYNRLLALIRDPHTANRDWAALLISQLERDTPGLRAALMEGAHDLDSAVRAESILGLAQRDRAVALPLVQRELEGQGVSMPLAEAAILVAHPSLIDNLYAFAEPSENGSLDDLILEAIAACEAAQKD